MTTGEMIDLLKQADPSGRRDVAVDGNKGASLREIISVEEGVHTEAAPVTIVIGYEYFDRNKT